jgi:hypothetical protein
MHMVVSVLLALLLQSPATGDQQAKVPVSLERIRQGLERPGRFDLPPPRPLRRPLFKVEINQRMLVFEEPWVDTSPTPPWVRPSTTTYQYDFLSAVTPEQGRSSTLHPCCDILPALGAVRDFVGKRIRSVKERRAKREVDEAMRAAGIRR